MTHLSLGRTSRSWEWCRFTRGDPMSPVLNMQVIGFGPASVGLAVAADRIGCLRRWLADGVVFLESRPEGHAGWLDYRILSNSPAGDFCAGVASEGELAGVLAGGPARELARQSREIVPLQHVDQFVRELCAETRRVAKYHGHDLVRYDSTVARIDCCSDGTFETVDRDGRVLARSRRLVLASGSIEQLDDTRLRAWTGPSWRGTRLDSAQVLRGRADDAIVDALERTGRIVILGGSHSGWSVAEYLLRAHGSRLGGDAVAIFSSRPVREYFDSVHEALRHGVVPEPAAVCPETGRVHRFDGLRGPSQSLFRAVRDRAERRVRVCAARPELIGPDELIVTAAGYRTRAIPILTDGGAPLALRASRGQCEADSAGRLADASGRCVRGLYGIGIGYAPRVGGSLRVGINCFHGSLAESILNDMGYEARSSGHRSRAVNS